VLLLGCDWGAAACVLAARAAAVFACDLNLATLRFAAVRAVAQNIGNLNLLCAGDTPRLPFGNQRFHMVAVSPDWLRMLAGQSGVSRILWHNVLQEIGRVLVPEGQVLVVARNPWSRQRWRQLRGPGGHGFVQAEARQFPGAREGFGKTRKVVSLHSYRRAPQSSGFRRQEELLPLPEFRKRSGVIVTTTPRVPWDRRRCVSAADSCH
jgi:SAM-dependent methyltransferase